jgi:predicted nucleic acid-binding protein
LSGPIVILDSDFLSSFLKIDQLSLVKEFYQVEHLRVPPAVYREVSRSPLLQRLVEISWLSVEAPEASALEGLSTQLSPRRLGAGEMEAIALALERKGSFLLMNDGRARREAAQLGVQVVNIPAFLLACKISSFLDRDQIAKTVRDLQEKDWYGFSQEVLTGLME